MNNESNITDAAEKITAAIDRNDRVRHWQPDGRYPGYETRINEQCHRETRPMKTPDGVPVGYERQMVQVWKGPKDIVIIGTPDESEDEETGHNCDAMGCGWDHVLWRIPLLLAFCFILPAAPIATTPGDPCAFTPCQHWHTTYIPTDAGVYPLDVYTPSLPRVWPGPPIVDIGDPPEPPVETPEPSVFSYVLMGLLTVVTVAKIGVLTLTYRLSMKVWREEVARKALEEK